MLLLWRLVGTESVCHLLARKQCCTSDWREREEDAGLRSLTVMQGRLEWRTRWRSALLASKRVAHGL